MSASTLSPPPSKHCRPCGRRKPIEEFRRVDSAKDLPRHSECRECRNRRERDDRRRRRLPRLRDRLRQVKAARTLERLNAVLHVMLAEFGGINGFAAAFHDLRETGSAVDRRLAIHGVLALIQSENAAREADRKAMEIEHRQRAELEEDPQLLAVIEQMGLERLRRRGDGSIIQLGSVIRDRLADLRRHGWTIELPKRQAG